MNIKKIILCLAACASMDVGFAQLPAVPLNPKIDSWLQTKLSHRHRITGEVFVMLKDQADLSAADTLLTREEKGRYVYDTLRHKALATQQPLVDFLKSQKVKYRQFYIQNMITVENPSAELLQVLARRNDVGHISGNPEFKLKLPTEKTAFMVGKHASIEPNITRIAADQVWDKFGSKGEGIVVAGQDTGVQWNHPALVHQYRGSAGKQAVDHNYNWHDAMHKRIGEINSSCGYNLKAPCDDVGHGTHTLGTVAGDDGKGNQIGVAPKAKWIACRNMYAGTGTPASYIECFEFFLAPYAFGANPLTDGEPAKAPHVMNNSWGCTASEGCKGNEILPSLEVMKKAGIMVVASAGNDGPGCSTINSPPAWHSGLMFSIGAFNHRNDNIAYFSSRGPSAIDGGMGPHIAAPGVTIRSCVPGDRYESWGWSGTSMAGPHAVGAVALLWSYDKTLIGKIDDTISLFEHGAESKTTSENCGGVPGTHVPNNTYGYGLLNVLKTLCLQSGKC